MSAIKPKSDGPPACFQNAAETNVPTLREFVHATTEQRREDAAHAALNSTSDFVNQLNLCLAQRGGLSDGSAAACKELFASAMATLGSECIAHADSLVAELQRQVDMTLRPAVLQGASKGQGEAMATVRSWGSSDRSV